MSAATYIPRLEWWPDECRLLGEPEPVRPANVPADAIWLPMVTTEDDFEGGYWVESEAAYAKRVLP